MYVCIYVCRNARMNVCTHERMHVYMHVCTHACTRAYMHVCARSLSTMIYAMLIEWGCGKVLKTLLNNFILRVLQINSLQIRLFRGLVQ